MKQKLSTQVNRIFEADGIRCLATLFILTFHYNVLLNEFGISKSIGFLTYANGTMGHFGVSLFIKIRTVCCKNQLGVILVENMVLEQFDQILC